MKKHLCISVGCTAVFLTTASLCAQGIRATQFRYSLSDGRNSVLLDWIRGTDDPIDVEIVESNVVLARTKAALGVATFELDDVAPGLYTFEVRGATGSIGSQAQSVLDERPEELGVPADVQCEAQEQAGRCAVSISWTHSDPAPAYYEIFLDGAFQTATQDASQSAAELPATTTGGHCVAVAAAVVKQGGALTGRFRGEAVESCCDIPCGAEPCPSPSGLSLAQVKYGAGAESCAVLARWESPSPYRVGTRIQLNGSEIDIIDGSLTSYVAGKLAPLRSYEIAVQGDCGPPSGVSGRAFELIPVLPETPHTSPLDGEPTCTWAPTDGGRTLVNWAPREPSVFVEVHVLRGNERIFHARITDVVTSAAVPGTTAQDAIELQFFAERDGYVYGSQPFVCRPPEGGGPRFTRGVCNGVGDRPNLTSAVFGLNFLFLGGQAPPCLEACNVNGDTAFNISDPVFILNFLFLGESPPPQWGGTEPICEEANPGNDCREAHAACAG